MSTEYHCGRGNGYWAGRGNHRGGRAERELPGGGRGLNPLTLARALRDVGEQSAKSPWMCSLYVRAYYCVHQCRIFESTLSIACYRGSRPLAARRSTEDCARGHRGRGIRSAHRRRGVARRLVRTTRPEPRPLSSRTSPYPPTAPRSRSARALPYCARERMALPAHLPADTSWVRGREFPWKVNSVRIALSHLGAASTTAFSH